MSEPIKEGDLVVVIRPERCCGDASYLGVVFRVARKFSAETRCVGCDKRFPPSVICLDEQSGLGYDLCSLKRIPPMSQLEHYRSEELLRRDVKDPA